MDELQEEIENLLTGYIGVAHYEKIKEISIYCEYVINNSKVLEKRIYDLSIIQASKNIENVISKIDLLERI